MSRASCRGISEAIHVATAQGLDVQMVAEGLPVTLDILRDRSASIEWDTFVKVLERLETLVGGPEALVVFTREMLDDPITKGLQRILGLAVGTQQVYRLLLGWLGPSLYGPQRTTLEFPTDGTIIATVEIAEGQKGSLPFMRISLGTMQGAPRLMGLGDALVEADLSASRSVFVITPPASRTAASRARQLMRVMTDAPGAIDELVRQQAELNTQSEALQASHRALRDREMQLERQVAEQSRAEAAADELGAQLQQAQKMDALDSFAGGIAHDFNNQLTVILAVGNELAAHPDDPARVSAGARDVIDAGERAAKLTRQLLRFSRRQVVQLRVIDVNEVLTKLETMLGRLTAGTVQVELDLDPDVLSIKVDPECLEQIVVNIVANARDAMPEGGSVTIRTCSVAPPSDEDRPPSVMLSVTDAGPGMAERVRARAFEPFFTTKSAGEGTGLGLSMVYGLVGKMDGQIELVSEPERGTSVHITFAGAAQSASSAAKTDPPTPKPAGGETVLVVDDEAGVRNVMVRILSRAGYQTIAATNEAEAIALMDGLDAPVDLLVSDIMLAGGRGTVVARHAASTPKGVRVLFVSGYAGDSASSEDALSIVNTRFLQKPFSVASFLEAVRSTLDGPVVQVPDRAEGPTPRTA